MSKFYLHMKAWGLEGNEAVSRACVFLAFGVNHTGSPVPRSASHFFV
jgi:hypothetical protein